MDRIVNSTEYGICLWSMDTLKVFLKSEKIRAKKLLALFQKDDEKYLKLQKDGVWIPIPQIDHGDYCIKFKNLNESFDDDWEQVLEYDGFNLDVRDGLWVSGLGSFLTFNEAAHRGEGREFTENGMLNYESDKEIWHITLNDYKIYHDVWCDIPAGKYLLTIRGYAKKGPVDMKEAKYGYQFELIEVEQFDGYKNPREEEYEFNIGQILRDREKGGR